ncbi:MAG: class B sortase [Ruminococcaceae bacterium]|nr:class B sortase [Oscillospiraceae bacterium]
MKRILIIIFGSLLVVSAAGIVGQRIYYSRGEEAYDKAESIAGLTEHSEETTAPETTAPETAAPETTAPETTAPETAAPETTAPETAAPETTAPETAAPETTAPETTAPETAAPETAVPETAAPETVAPETEAVTTVGLLAEVDLAALQKINPDVIGWIMIPDTTISYPIVQGEDNAYYLNRTWEGEWNPAGSIYLDYRCTPDFSDFHSILYGHRMYNDSMFNALKGYENQDFLEAHPYVYVFNGERVLEYRVFAAYEADAINGSSWRLGLTEAEGQQALFNYGVYYSVIDAGFIPSAEGGDKLLTLSTCTEEGGSDTRWVVHCVLEGAGE